MTGDRRPATGDRRRAVGLAILLALVATRVAAQAPAARSHLYDRWQLSGSGTVVLLGPTVRVDAADGSAGSELDRDELGTASRTLEPRVSLRWRPGRRHELEVGYQRAGTDGGRVLTDTIAVGDTSFAAGLRTQSTLRADQAFLAYRFAFHTRERSQIGAGVGLGAIFFKADIDAVAGATAGGPDTVIVPFGVSKSVTVPTLSFGLYGRWRLGDHWYLESDARALTFAISRISVLVVEAGAATRFFVRPRLGFELGYGLTGVRVTLDTGSAGSAAADLAGRLQYTLQNLRLGIVVVP